LPNNKPLAVKVMGYDSKMANKVIFKIFN